MVRYWRDTWNRVHIMCVFFCFVIFMKRKEIFFCFVIFMKRKEINFKPVAHEKSGRRLTEYILERIEVDMKMNAMERRGCLGRGQQRFNYEGSCQITWAFLGFADSRGGQKAWDCSRNVIMNVRKAKLVFDHEAVKWLKTGKLAGYECKCLISHHQRWFSARRMCLHHVNRNSHVSQQCVIFYTFSLVVLIIYY